MRLDEEGLSVVACGGIECSGVLRDQVQWYVEVLSAVVTLQGDMGSGKSHLLAAAVCSLALGFQPKPTQTKPNQTKSTHLP